MTSDEGNGAQYMHADMIQKRREYGRGEEVARIETIKSVMANCIKLFRRLSVGGAPRFVFTTIRERSESWPVEPSVVV